MKSDGASVGEIVRFLVVGGLNTLVGYALFAFLVWRGLGAQPALVLAFAAGVIWNYNTHARLVFRGARRQRLVAYSLTYVALYLINAGSLKALMSLGLSPLLAQAICLPFVAVLAYVAIGRVLTGRYPWTPPPIE